MNARVLQVNAAPHGGVPKLPVAELRVHRLGAEGDAQADTKHHGGADQAVLIIEKAWLDRLVAQGFPVFPGALGENITSDGLDLARLPPGARLRAGEVLLEVTKQREPCRTIHVYGAHIGPHLYDKACARGDATSPRWDASGLYCRVVEEGTVRPRDPLAYEGTSPSTSRAESTK